jgi:hypothetical protein
MHLSLCFASIAFIWASVAGCCKFQRAMLNGWPRPHADMVADVHCTLSMGVLQAITCFSTTCATCCLFACLHACNISTAVSAVLFKGSISILQLEECTALSVASLASLFLSIEGESPAQMAWLTTKAMHTCQALQDVNKQEMQLSVFVCLLVGHVDEAACLRGLS